MFLSHINVSCSLSLFSSLSLPRFLSLKSINISSGDFFKDFPKQITCYSIAEQLILFLKEVRVFLPL